MKQITALELKQSAWYKQWFDSNYYHTLYQNRDEQEAADFIDRLLQYLDPADHSTMIDVGCGAGRHSRRLAKAGHDVIGIDLSLQSIRKAREFEQPLLRFFQHDMRKSFGHARFDYVFNLFTSFGYFKDQDEHDLVIGNHAEALKPGGLFVMDYLNAPYAAAHLIPIERKEIDGVEFDIERWQTETHFFKRIVIRDLFKGPAIEHTEQVAGFSIDDFRRMFASAGLQIVKLFGDYQLSEYDTQNSPRLIMIARRDV
jgi:SAM-dependent methyltransferase